MRFSLLAFFSMVLLLASCKPTKKKNDFIYKKDSMMNRFIPVDWAHSTNIYEVNVRQYTEPGTFNAFMQHLPRLKAMGVQTIWFMPITPISEKNKKG
ncbi:MAG TPA: 1,4-alpha-glucan branching protein, partial [Chitinophagaceae bacterium]|nr:1,4-alpha-glucan branching protein [Chitinophagaceae bacterium]